MVRDTGTILCMFAGVVSFMVLKDGLFGGPAVSSVQVGLGALGVAVFGAIFFTLIRPEKSQGQNSRGQNSHEEDGK